MFDPTNSYSICTTCKEIHVGRPASEKDCRCRKCWTNTLVAYDKEKDKPIS